MIQNIEEKLREYCKTQDSDYFLDNCWEYFKIMAAHVATEYGIKSKEMEETIQDLTSHAAIQLPLKYVALDDKSARGLLYIIMKQYLLGKFEYDGRQKRNKAVTVYLEETDENNAIHFYEVQFDELQYMKETLIANKALFDKLETTLQRKIANKIIKLISTEQPRVRNYIMGLAKQCRCSLKSVYNTVDAMHKLLKQEQVVEK